MSNNKGRKNTTRLIFLLAVLSFLIATAQGIIYYKNYDSFFKVLLVLQNSINAFGFKASVTIKDTVAFMKDNPSVLNKGIGYAYFVVSDMISQLEAGEEVSIQRPFEINKENISNQDEN